MLTSLRMLVLVGYSGAEEVKPAEAAFYRFKTSAATMILERLR